ncbi:DNA adenine methylase [Helicobacter sp. 23-1048]
MTISSTKFQAMYGAHKPLIKPTAKPFLKWAGGKAGILDLLLRFVPQGFNAYFEPFLGGGALFFALQNSGIFRTNTLNFKRTKNVVLSDKNAELINAYRTIQASPSEVLGGLKSLQESHCKEVFYTIRNLDRSADFENLSADFRAARFIYLNKTCFNGLCRYNSKGQFNTPMGSYTNPKIYDEDLILSAHNALQGVEILNADFASVCKSAKKGDFVYFDPPYFPLNKTSSFVSYTDNFLESEQIRLCETFKILETRGVKVLQSNSNTEFIRKLYKDFELIEVKVRRAINCKGDKRGKVSELIIKGKYE